MTGKYCMEVLVRKLMTENTSANHTNESTRNARNWSKKNSIMKNNRPIINGTNTNVSITWVPISSPIGMRLLMLY